MDRTSHRPKEETILSIRNLKKYFPVSSGLFSKANEFVHAVDDVELDLKRGETVGLVGESGCGKSTLGRIVLRLIEPTSGEVLFKGQNIFQNKKSFVRYLRQNMQIIFQDPYYSLNPRMTLETTVGEALIYHKICSRSERKQRVVELLDKVGLDTAYLKRYPHEFSGGQRQRIGIARAFALNPQLIIADEPVSALDVSIQAQIINLLIDLQNEFKLTYLIISHDLRVIKHISDQIIVMYLGKFVEKAGTNSLFKSPLHPYTQALLSAIPATHPDEKRKQKSIAGDVPSPIHLPSGCRFHTRCRFRLRECDQIEPELKEIDQKHWVACHAV